MTELKIKDTTYKIHKLPARRAAAVGWRILGLLGASVQDVGALLEGLGKNKDAKKQKKTRDLMVKVIANVFCNNEADDAANFLCDIAQEAKFQTPSGAWLDVDVDQHFTGDLKAMFELIWIVIKENYGDFLQESLKEEEEAEEEKAD